LISSPSQLLVVLPVFNEQESVPRVIREWFGVLDSEVRDFTILAIDDGSTDTTLKSLESLESELGTRLEIISRPNRGHGQSCIEGYRIAIDRKISFILQIDSDGQSDPRHFPDFWNLREHHDVIYGKRSRHDGARRIFASAVLRLMLRLFAGADCVDANVPYRLMDTRACTESIRAVPGDIFLSNVALAVVLSKNPAVRHGSLPITFPPRHGGEPSVPFSKFAMKGVELFRQLRKSGISR